MKILVLCNKSPWPLHEGGPIAMYAVISGLLKAGHQVKVLAANTNKYYVDPATLPEDFVRQTSIEFAYIDLAVKPLPALYNYLTGQSYHVSRFSNRDFAAKLMHILQEETFDVIQAEMLYTTVYLDIIRKYSNAPVILRAHNIEHLIWKRQAENCRNPLKRHYLNHLFLTLRNYELSVLNKVDGIVAITPVDALAMARLAKNVPLLSVPFGIDTSAYSDPPPPPSGVDLFHIGSMNWPPNAEGIRWFLNEVWPEIHRTLPGIRLFLAGRMMPDWLLHLRTGGVVIVGEVPDAREFMQKHAVMVVPLLSGSGIRIKIVEAMASGKAVISTGIGAEGIEYTNGENMLIADSREEFIKAIHAVVSTPGLKEKLGENARKLILTNHDNSILISRLVDFYTRVRRRP